MTERLYDGNIAVEDLGEPDPLPPELADELERDEAGADAPDDPALDARKAKWATNLIGLLFKLAGVAGGIRMPAAVKAAIRGVWQLDTEEAAEIGVLLAPIVPERFVRSRAAQALGTLGVVAGVLKLAAAVGERTEATVQLRHEVIVHGSHTSAGPEPAPDAGAGRAGPRRGGADRAAAVQPGAERAPAPVDGFTGAGLGLGEGE